MTELKLPEEFNYFLKKRGWKLFDYQIEFLENLNKSIFDRYIISSDTGTGKTISLFLPFIIDIINKKPRRIIYISPLKSILSDLYENLRIIISELGLNINIDKRTGDESFIKKKKQIENPQSIILTTPESLALMTTKKESDIIFKNTHYFAIDELNEIISSKRGDQLVLSISRILEFTKNIKLFCSSANIENYQYIVNWISFNGKTKVIKNKYDKKLKIDISLSDNIPDFGHSVDFAISQIYRIIKNKKSIIFVNTRAQSEILFKNLYLNFPDLKLGIYHSSLSKKIRKETEQKIRNNEINTIVSTSSLEMGIDWKNINKVIIIGTPKSVNKLIQRTGRSNHKYNEISEALLIPTNKFEFIECVALKKLITSKTFDSIIEKNGAKDVLCQHLLLIACHSSFSPNKIYKAIKNTFPYRKLSLDDFHSIMSFIYDGGYVLKQYKHLTKLKRLKNGDYQIKDKIVERQVLMNAGTIIESNSLRIVTSNGKLLGNVDESFVNSIRERSIFIFAGLTLICLKIQNDQIIVKPNKRKTQKVPVYSGGTLPLKSNLSDEILNILENHDQYNFPSKVKSFISKQEKESGVPKRKRILVETFPYQNGKYIFFHTFLGRETNQTISNLLINFLNKKNIFALNYILNDYSFGLFFDKVVIFKEEHLKSFFLSDFSNLNSLDTAIAKRIFREIALISGLLKKKDIYNLKNNNYINSDIIFDTLIKYEPKHIILKITKEEVENHLLNACQIYKLKKLKFDYKKLTHCSEFSKSLIMEKEKIKTNELI